MGNEIEKLLNDAGFETARLDKVDIRDGPIWECKVGLLKGNYVALPGGCDTPMRQAVSEAFMRITGQYPDFNFSGWGAKLSKVEQSIVNPESDNPV